MNSRYCNKPSCSLSTSIAGTSDLNKIESYLKRAIKENDPKAKDLAEKRIESIKEKRGIKT